MIFKRRSPHPNVRNIVETTLNVRRRIPVGLRAPLAERLGRRFQPLADAGLHTQVIDGLEAVIVAAERSLEAA